MVKTNSLLLILLLLCGRGYSQSDRLSQKIKRIVEAKKAKVGVCIIGNDRQDTVSLNASEKFPMQSVFKFHIAIAILSGVDKGKYNLNQKIAVTPKDLLPDTWSPMRDQYPGGATLPLSEIVEYAVSQSDNNACDILLRLTGGTDTIEDFFIQKNFGDISIKVNEEEMHQAWNNQFKNLTTPESATHVLIACYLNNPVLLSPSSHEFIWAAMLSTQTGKNRIRGQLPEGTPVAHKTGSSGSGKDGIIAAANDIGIVFLPDGKYFFISVFITDSHESEAATDQIISDIAKAAYDFFLISAK